MKKTLISALAIMLALSAFTACGGDDSTSYDDSATQKTQQRYRTLSTTAATTQTKLTPRKTPRKTPKQQMRALTSWAMQSRNWQTLLTAHSGSE